MEESPDTESLVPSVLRTLEKSRTDLAQLLVGSDVGIWEYDFAGRCFSRDAEWFRKKLGPIVDEPRGKDYHGHLVHPADLARFNEKVLECLVGGIDSFEIEYRVASRGNDSIWLQSRGFVVARSSTGRAERIVGTDHVIEDSREVRRILAIEKNLLRGLNEASSRGEAFEALLQTIRWDHGFEHVCVLDLHPKAMGERMPVIVADTLFRPGKVQASWLAERYPDHERTGIEGLGGADDPYQGLLPEGRGFRAFLRAMVHRDGKLTALFLVGLRTPAAFDHLEITAIGNYCIQMETALERIEREVTLRNRQRAWEQLVDAVEDYVVVLDRSGIILHANESFRSAFFGPRGWARKNLREFYPYQQSGNDEIGSMLETAPLVSQLPLRDSGGAIRLLEVKTLKGEWQSRLAILCGMRDLSSRGRSFDQLRERDELLRTTAGALGRMIEVSEQDGDRDEIFSEVAGSFRARRLVLYESVLGATGTSGFEPIVEWHPSRDLRPARGFPFHVWRDLPFDADEERFFAMASRDLNPMQWDRLQAIPDTRIVFIAIRVHDRDWGYIRLDVEADSASLIERHLWLLQILGSGLATQVVRSRLEESLREANLKAEETNLRLEEAIEQARLSATEAQRANRSKSEFIANISHEIRTPLNAILGFAELLGEEIGDQRHVEYLHAINASGSALLSIINDLLDLSRIEAGRMPFAPEMCNLRSLLEEIARIFSSKASRKSLTLSLRTQPNLPERLLLDPARVRQILFNLVGNAVKFTNEGFVVIEASFDPAAGPEAVGDLVLRVVDSGPGIAQGTAERVFEAFERIESVSQGKEGTGLGLTISRRLTEMMGGTLKVIGAEGEGSTFEFALPGIAYDNRVDSNDSRETVLKDMEPDPSLTGKRILVVDDSSFDRMLAEIVLRHLSVEIESVETVRDASDRIDTFRPDLILLDLEMPGGGGDQLVEHLLNLEGDGALPEILVWSALEKSRISSYLRRFRGIAVISKPIRRNLFLQSIRDLVRERPTLRLYPQWRAGTPAVDPPPAGLVDIAKEERLPNRKVGGAGVGVDGSHPQARDEGLRQLCEECERIRSRLQVSLIHGLIERTHAYLAEHPDCVELERWIQRVERSVSSFDVHSLRNLLQEFPVMDALDPDDTIQNAAP